MSPVMFFTFSVIAPRSISEVISFCQKEKKSCMYRTKIHTLFFVLLARVLLALTTAPAALSSLPVPLLGTILLLLIVRGLVMLPTAHNTRALRTQRVFGRASTPLAFSLLVVDISNARSDNRVVHSYEAICRIYLCTKISTLVRACPHM
jgi:hypothetical protein